MSRLIERGLYADAEVNAQMRASIDQTKMLQIEPVMVVNIV
jgi:hypothetical protein